MRPAVPALSSSTARTGPPEEIISNAIRSATRNHRFSPVAPSELPELTYKVDILTKPEPVKSKADLNPKKYGLVVQHGEKWGLLLPDLEGVESAEQQINICRAKGNVLPNEPVKLFRFKVRRFE